MRVLAIALLVTACAETTFVQSRPDGGGDRDARPQPAGDVGASGPTGDRADTTLPPSVDQGATGDRGAPIDQGAARDAGPDPDALAPTDALAAPDARPAGDGAPSRDLGPVADAGPHPAGPVVGPVAGGARLSSPRYRLSVSVGAPMPVGATRSARHRAVVGVAIPALTP